MASPLPKRFLISEPQFIKRELVVEVLLILLIAIAYSVSLINTSSVSLQQTGEHSEASTISILMDSALHRHSQFPLWNPYLQTGIPHAGDPITQFFNPLVLLIAFLLPAIPALNLSIVLSLFLAGLGQLLLGYVVGFRFPVRIWSALLFMLSGGLAMLWRLGWAGLLIGVAWVPFCLAFTLWALVSRKRAPLVLAAISIAMLFLSGSMYWILYFAGIMLFLIISVLVFRWMDPEFNKKDLWGILSRVALIALIAIGLSAVYLFPFSDAYIYMEKHHSPDLEQRGSQPIAYALFNYLIKDFEYFQSGALGKTASGSWMYLGILPFILLLLLPLVLQIPKRQSLVVLLLFLTLFLLAWQASAFTPFSWIYKAIPFLYNFRFPNRILIIATIPLIILAGFGLEYLFWKISGIETSIQFSTASGKGRAKRRVRSIMVSSLINFALVALMAFSIYDVFKNNKDFAFSQGILRPEAEDALTWLKKADPYVYYVQIGNPDIFWDWLPAAFFNEIKVINFDDYGRKLRSFGHQTNPETPIRATAQYVFAHVNNPPEGNAELVRTFNDINLYRMPESLPYSFTVSKQVVAAQTYLLAGNVIPAIAAFDGPNQIFINLTADDDDSYLVALESYYPGWNVYIDDQPAQIVKVGDYLGVSTQPGNHTYVFRFAPVKFTAGLVVSLITVVLVILYSASGWFAKKNTNLLERGRTQKRKKSSR